MKKNNFKKPGVMSELKTVLGGQLYIGLLLIDWKLSSKHICATKCKQFGTIMSITTAAHIPNSNTCILLTFSRL